MCLNFPFYLLLKNKLLNGTYRAEFWTDFSKGLNRACLKSEICISEKAYCLTLFTRQSYICLYFMCTHIYQWLLLYFVLFEVLFHVHFKLLVWCLCKHLFKWQKSVHTLWSVFTVLYNLFIELIVYIYHILFHLYASLHHIYMLPFLSSY